MAPFSKMDWNFRDFAISVVASSYFQADIVGKAGSIGRQTFVRIHELS